MAESLIVGGKLYSNVDYITVRNSDNKDVKYYRQGDDSGGGGTTNYRVATKEEIDQILDQVVI